MARGRDTARTAAIVDAFHGFAEGRDAAIETARGWVAAVVRGANWRFADAEGVIQDTLLKLVALVNRGAVRDPEGFHKFVLTVARRTCVTLYHRERARREHERDDGLPEHAEPAAEPPGTARLESEERLALLAEIVQRLPEACRILWDRIYFRRQRPEQVARDLGIRPGTLRVRVHRCTEKARALHETLSRGTA